MASVHLSGAACLNAGQRFAARQIRMSKDKVLEAMRYESPASGGGMLSASVDLDSYRIDPGVLIHMSRVTITLQIAQMLETWAV